MKHLFSYEDRCERVGFWFEVARIISVQRKNMAQKYSQKMDNFWSTCPKASIRVISEYHNLRDLCVWSSRGFWQAWNCSKSWCIPNYQLSISFKNSSFLLPDFRRIREMIFGSKILRPIAWVAVIKSLFDFFKIVPLEVPHFYSSDFTMKRSVY